VLSGETLAKQVRSILSYCTPPTSPGEQKASMINLDQMKTTRRDQQVLKLLVLGCSNKDIAAELNISPRTVKQHLRTLFLRAGIKQGRKRVILATAIFEKEQMSYVATRTVNLPGNQSNHVGLAGAD
jgi:DNA-binding NarL/FixJ family response regulator